MPIYTIRLRINVPGLGERLVDFTAISAATIEDAIAQARATVIIEPIAGQKTGDA